MINSLFFKQSVHDKFSSLYSRKNLNYLQKLNLQNALKEGIKGPRKVKYKDIT